MLTVSSSDSTSVAYICAMLHDLVFPIHRFGYEQLIVAISRYAQGDILSMTKELYPYVAKHFGYTDWRAIEHAIRTVITDTWGVRDSDIWESYFPRYQKAPSNKQFIATLAERLQQNAPPENERG